VEERWEASDGLSLFVRQALPEGRVRGRVVVLHGYSEHSGRYLKVLRALAEAGFAALAPDHRGHGRTGPRLGHTPSSERILDDLHGMTARWASEHPEGPTFLLGSSMGGLLSLRLLQEAPDAYAGAVLQAPAVAVPTDIPMAVVHAVRAVAKVAPGLPVRPFFKPERASRDPAFQAWMRTDPFTYRGWVRAGTGAHTYRLIRKVHAELAEVRTPLLITVGSDDVRVRPEVTEALRAAVGGPAERLVFEGLRHEAHQEPDGHRVIDAWVRWLVERAP
jgi:alpha-beta hydrolase superfamily lysophospholipase